MVRQECSKLWVLCNTAKIDFFEVFRVIAVLVLLQVLVKERIGRGCFFLIDRA